MGRYGFIKENYDVHINFPGGIPVDGPSAGTAMFLAVYSAFTETPVPNDIAFTGEIGIHGQVLPVGGVEEKLEAARMAGAKCVLIPGENWRKAFADMEMRVIPVDTVQEILEKVFLPESLSEGREVLEERGIG